MSLHESTDAGVAPSLATPASAFPSIGASVGWIILYFALQAVCTAAFLAASMGGASPADLTVAAHNPVIILWGLVAAALVQLSLMWLYLRKASRAKILGLDSFGHLPLRKAAALALALIIGAMAFNFVYATYAIPGIGMQEDMAKMIAAIPRTPVNITAGLFTIAIAAPVVEELLFRGMLQNALAKRVPVWAAIILSSLVFAAVHLQPYAIPGLMSLSLAFGYLYHRTGSLRLNILLHMINNTAALLLTQGAG